MSARRRRAWPVGGVLAALVAAGCTLAEVATPDGEDVLVVEAVLRTDREAQQVLLHRSLQGGAAVPVPGAVVEVAGPGGSVVRYEEQEARACVDGLGTIEVGGRPPEVSCYLAVTGPPVQPGATYELRVSTADGRQLRGRTTVPGVFSLLSPAAPAQDGEVSSIPSCSLAPGTALPLVWLRSRGAWSYLASLELFGLRRPLQELGVEDPPDNLQLTGVSVSESDTTLLLPTEFGVFERLQYEADVLLALQKGLPPGVEGLLVLAAADRNYVNAVRGGRFNPSGSVRVSSVVGDGVGVFGSLVPLSLHLAVGSTDTPPCLPR